MNYCLMMKISDIITKYYPKYRSRMNTDKTICLGKTEEDVLDEVMLTALRVFGDKEITEEEGKAYLDKTLYQERHFIYKRKKGDRLVFGEMPDIPDKSGD